MHIVELPGMSKCKFIIPAYKAIKEASIENDGITVIAGENGSGKSTLSRTMYYMVNIMSNFSDYVYNEAHAKVITLGRKISEAMTQTNRQIKVHSIIRNRFGRLADSENFDELENNFFDMLNEFKPALQEFFISSDAKKRTRILDFLEVNDGNPHLLADAVVDSLSNQFASIIEKAYEDIDSKPRSILMQYIQNYGWDMHDFPVKNIKLLEDGVDLITMRHFSSPLSIRRAIYIDTPMAVNDNYNMSTRYWDKLTDLMNRQPVELSLSEGVLKKKLQNILSGDITTEKDQFSGRTKLCYLREDGLEIDLVNAATGFKAFAYILRLLVNGYLKKDTLLLIDEPEAHLHPQWIVEFANILVLLNKTLGVKVVITSHNPDMVSAIRQISEAEGIIDNTRFYLAEKTENKYSFVYKDLGADIGPIFESFNIALNRIEYYGAGSL